MNKSSFMTWASDATNARYRPHPSLATVGELAASVQHASSAVSASTSVFADGEASLQGSDDRLMTSVHASLAMMDRCVVIACPACPWPHPHPHRPVVVLSPALLWPDAGRWRASSTTSSRPTD